MEKRIFIKRLTPAEVGDTGTHEKYIRLPNDFDYENFFHSKGWGNKSVIQVDFQAAINGCLNEIIPLRMVYYANSNQEKRIPSLGQLFEKHGVKKDDIVYFESHNKNGVTTFKISFFKESQISDSPILCILNEDELKNEGSPLEFGDFIPRQIIYYGAPGTGKSHTVKKEEDEGKITCIRTTFHPDSDYATFVGCYKPHKIKDSQSLTYEFVEQAFLEAYKQAWTNPKEEIALVIEEINRGNCAQVFGDIFQLLGRSNDGWSTYPIKADTDIAEHLKELRIPGYAATMNKRFGLDKEGNDRYPDRDWFGFMALPPNMSILATMNTSDQSLFPIDSAFKRRWDWKYIKIKEGKDENGDKLNWNVDVKMDDSGTLLSWWDFIKKINEIIASMTSSADKQLGYFFCCAKDGVIDEETFVSKVIFYLWNDVFKDYGFEDASLFRYTAKDEDGKDMEKDLTFPDFYDEEGEKVNTERLTDFVNRVMSWKVDNKKGED